MRDSPWCRRPSPDSLLRLWPRAPLGHFHLQAALAAAARPLDLRYCRLEPPPHSNAHYDSTCACKLTSAVTRKPEKHRYKSCTMITINTIKPLTYPTSQRSYTSQIIFHFHNQTINQHPRQTNSVCKSSTE